MSYSEYNKNPRVCVLCNCELPYEKRTNKFCSRSCAATYNNTGRNISDAHKSKVSETMRKKYPITKQTPEIRNCVECNKQFLTKRGSKKSYCEVKCYTTSPRGKYIASKAGKLSASKMVRRSKNEIHFANLCKEMFAEQEVLENITLFNGWDADVILPKFKIAILWNGNWHRIKITKRHSLSQVKTRDSIKLQEISNAGYTPYIINDYGGYNKSFVEKEFEKFIKTFNLNVGL
jgi:hypothetical protein